MWAVLLAAASIAAATGIGALFGRFLDELSPKIHRLMSCAAAGIMLFAAIDGLVIPSVEMSDGNAIPACFGIILGGIFLNGLNRVTPKALAALELERNAGQVKNLLFVLALAIHHFPEGLAAGVSFGSGNAAETAMVCAGIALQNVPEAMIMIPAMEQAGFGRKGGFLAAGAGGAVEILGLFLGCAAVHLTTAALPLLLAFAAGTMLFIILDSMVPEQHTEDTMGESTYGILGGFCMMLLLSSLLEKYL